VQTVGLALATDLAPRDSQPTVVAVLSLMLLFGMVLAAVVFGVAVIAYFWKENIKGVKESAVGDPTAFLNEFPVHEANLRCRAPKRDQPNLQPEEKASCE
jgi:BCD family chlorophyll transporter-like MFS transporter